MSSKTRNSNTSSSIFEHYGSKLGSYRGQPFVVGQLSTIDKLINKAAPAEILTSNEIWNEKSNYPFSDGISKYGIESTNDSGNLMSSPQKFNTAFDPCLSLDQKHMTN